MKNRYQWKRTILRLGIAFTVVFIWGNSLLPKEQSEMLSGFLKQLLGIGVGGGAGGGSFYLRKTAHFLEFFALGVQLSLYAALFRPKGRERLLELTCCGMLVPIIDETIQIFNNRSAAVADIWIDMSGFAVGSAAILLFFAVWRFFRRKSSGR